MSLQFARMHFSKITCSFYLLIIALIIQNVHGAANPLYFFCSNPEKFTANSAYGSNLNNLFGYLKNEAPPTGFGQGSIGQKPNQANGLALCRGDVSSSDCNACIADAGVEIRKRCPSNKGAVIWYDNCMVRYSNKDFFGKIDTQDKFYMWNSQDVEDPVTFNAKTKALLTTLAKEAYGTGKLYATGESDLGDSTTLYGLVQCTRDLSKGACNKCLDGILGELPSCCGGKQGGRVLSGSCNFRYETYAFVN